MHTGLQGAAGPAVAAGGRETILAVDNVSRVFLSRGQLVVALKDTTLEVREGEFLTIVGPSGCGKSTLLNLICGLLKPSHGEIRYRGKPIVDINTSIGYVTQRDNLLPWRTLVGNVELGMEVRGVPPKERRERALGLIQKVGLAGFEHHYPHELSGGMRQRANIIRTLAYDPELILMDEPFGPLDALTRGILQSELLRLWLETRKTVVFVTHDLAEAIALSDRVITMTARPGTVKHVAEVPIARPRDVFHIHDEPEFRSTYDAIWDLLLAEVGRGRTA